MQRHETKHDKLTVVVREESSKSKPRSVQREASVLFSTHALAGWPILSTILITTRIMFGGHASRR